MFSGCIGNILNAIYLHQTSYEQTEISWCFINYSKRFVSTQMWVTCCKKYITLFITSIIPLEYIIYYSVGLDVVGPLFSQCQWTHIVNFIYAGTNVNIHKNKFEWNQPQSIFAFCTVVDTNTFTIYSFKRSGTRSYING